IDVAGELTAWGTNAIDVPAPADAEVVRRLREAGAVIIGKTNVPELTIWPFTESATFGATRNPWDLQRAPGGSSGGSAAAVAAGLVGAALGYDGAGSIRIPAAWGGLFGLKPQRGRMPPGVLARLDADAARALEETVELLRSLGHEVFERDPDYGPGGIPEVLTRYLRGIHDDARGMPHPERLERRTRAMARLGGLIPPALLARPLANAAEFTRRMNRVLEDHD